MRPCVLVYPRNTENVKIILNSKITLLQNNESRSCVPLEKNLPRGYKNKMLTPSP